jgi:HAD superfamily hydrolase (TIGR01484 family)
VQPLTDFPRDACRAVRGVFVDIDDTLTTAGRLTAEAYCAMERLQRGGIKVMPITGRPAGWCDHIARMWPVDGVVGENGAFYFYYDRVQRAMQRRFTDRAEIRARHRERLQAIGQEILRTVPGAGIAADQRYRETDLAIDFCEDVPRLPQAAIDRIVQLMQRHGLTVKVSSIHVNGWFGTYDKLSTTKTLMHERHAVDLGSERDHYVFIGDSPNDVPMFVYFPHSVGVANIREFSGHLDHEPRYVTRAASGAGFCELVDRLLGSR